MRGVHLLVPTTSAERVRRLDVREVCHEGLPYLGDRLVCADSRRRIVHGEMLVLLLLAKVEEVGRRGPHPALNVGGERVELLLQRAEVFAEEAIVRNALRSNERLDPALENAPDEEVALVEVVHGLHGHIGGDRWQILGKRAVREWHEEEGATLVVILPKIILLCHESFAPAGGGRDSGIEPSNDRKSEQNYSRRKSAEVTYMERLHDSLHLESNANS